MTGDDLEALIRTEWADLLVDFDLETCSSERENTAYVRGASILLQVLASRDGVYITYIDQTKSDLPIFSIDGLLLIHRRDQLQFSAKRPPSSSFSEYTQIGLAALARHLRRAGQDVLRGERGWMMEHGTSRAVAGPEIRAFLDSPHTFRPIDA